MSRAILKGNASGTGSITLESPATNSDRTIALPDSDGTIAFNNQLGMRNRIINGAMVIDQRNAGASVTPSNGQYTLDRWRATSTAASKFSVQQSTDAPTGFVNSSLITSLSAYSVGSSDYFLYQQRIEGYNIADLGWGTANAKTVTLSFWVRSSLTGTFGGSLYGGSAYSYPFSYTISSTNTWTQISVTVVGSTSGTWDKTNGTGLTVYFGLGVGSTNSGTAGAWASGNYFAPTGAVSVVGTSGATFYITGVQLEVGSSATPFDTRAYGTELALCQRYFQYVHPIFVMFPWSSATQIIRSFASFMTQMRATPTITMGTKTTGTGTLGASAATDKGFVVTGGGGLGDVVGYNPDTKAEAEL